MLQCLIILKQIYIQSYIDKANKSLRFVFLDPGVGIFNFPFYFAMKRCPIAAKIAGLIGILPCSVGQNRKEKKTKITPSNKERRRGRGKLHVSVEFIVINSTQYKAKKGLRARRFVRPGHRHF